MMVVEASMDNGSGLAIETDGVDKAARGFFWQDVSYGFDSLDGFVVFYNRDSQDWGFTSLALAKGDFKFEESDLNLTDDPSNGRWECVVLAEDAPTPSYERLYCSSPIPDEPNFEKKEIRYEP